ncbi:MAG: hypothetical protein KFB95_07355 [Simkaniaceae bacterium]|nr:MAG: hypothetical protein KFB95_07355 [Simkaniaceae bacterium]
MRAFPLRIVEYGSSYLSYFGGMNLGKAYCALAVGQGAMAHLQRTHPSFAKETRTITEALYVLNLFGVLWSSGKLINVLSKKYKIAFFSPDVRGLNWTLPEWSMERILFVNGLGIALLKGSYHGLPILSSYIRGSFRQGRTQNNAEGKLEWKAPDLYHQSRLLYLSQIVLNVALLIVGSNRMETLFTLGGLSGALYSSVKMQWLKFSATDDKVYEVLLLPDPEDSQRRFVCQHRHSVTVVRLMNHLASQLLSKRGLPNCPKKGCNEAPSYARYWDQSRWTGSGSRGFSVLYLGYGITQLFLAYMQYRKPLLARSIYKMQLAMMCADGVRNLTVGEMSRRVFPLFVAISALTFAYIFMLEKDLHPSALEKLKSRIPEADLQNIKIGTLPPFSYKLMKWLLVNKILVDLTDIPHSDQKKFLYSSALIGALSLYYLSKLNWLSFERKITRPLEGHSIRMFENVSTFPKELNNSVADTFKRRVESTTISLQFLDPSSILLADNGEAIRAIYDYTTDFFKDSFWECYLLSSSTGKKLRVEAQVLSGKIDFHGINLFKLLNSWSGSIDVRNLSFMLGSWDGPAKVGISTQ